MHVVNQQQTLFLSTLFEQQYITMKEWNKFVRKTYNRCKQTFENFEVFVPRDVFRRPRHFCPRLSQSPEDALATERFSIKYI